jgi:hypothetical protein
MRATSWGAALAVLLGAGGASAQVNAEGLRPDAVMDHEGWAGGGEASVAFARGNVDFLDVGGGARLEWQRLRAARPSTDGAAAAPQEAIRREGESDARDVRAPPDLWQRVFVTANARHAEQGTRRFLGQAFAHVRWIAMAWRRLGSDVFAQVQFDDFLRLRRRVLLGVGARVVLVHHPRVRVWGGTGAMFEHERIRVDEGAPDPTTTSTARWTSYLAIRLSFADARLLLQNTTYVQPRFDRLADLRVLDELQVLSVVTPQLALGITFSTWFDRRPPTSVDTTDRMRCTNRC